LAKTLALGWLLLSEWHSVEVLPASCRQLQAGSLRFPNNLIAEVFEIRGDSKVATAQKGNDRLQFVLLLSGDPDLSVLHLALHFEVLRFDGLNYFFRFVAFQTLLNFQLLSRVAQRRNCSIELFDIAQIDSTLRQFTNDNLAQTAQPRCVFRGQNDLFFLVQNFRLGVLKVETGGQFFACLV